jgi:hypothetical protein
VPDNLGQFYGELVFAIAPSTKQQGLVWAGTNDGKVWYTRDAGATWNDVTTNITGLPAWGTVRKIDPSPFDAGTAYAAIDFHLMENREPFIYKTADFGQTWTKISGGLPSGHPLDYVLSVTENPNRQGMLFAGTGHGFFYSMDDGATWAPFSEGLPAAPVTWITVEPRYHDVVISTYGRGLFILRDITRLEQADRIPSDATTYLYEPRPAFRLARAGSADFLYTLKTTPQGRAKVEILNEAGAVIRTMQATPAAGLNRVTWDLRYDAPKAVALRTIPPDNPHIWEEQRFKGKDTRPIIHWGIEQAASAGPLAAPGTYSVRLTVADQTVTRPFEVLKDLSIDSSAADIAESTETQLRIREDLDLAADAINRLELLRRQLEDQAKTAKTAAAKSAIADLDKTLLATELRLVSRTDLHSDDKWYVESYKVYMNLVWLNGVIGTGAGDVSGGADSRPTEASLQVLDGIEKDLAVAKAEFDALMAKDVSAFNKDAKRKGLTPVDAAAPDDSKH